MDGSTMLNKTKDIDRFYEILKRLEVRMGGYRLLKSCSSRSGWPARGVYFFFEDGEQRTDSPDLRVVRVGTHAVSAGSRTTLWDRLSQHRGSVSTMGGNHRGSIFRLHVGEAVLRSGRAPVDVSTTWGTGSNTTKAVKDAELPVEQAVSSYIGGMPLLWIEADDEPGKNSIRGYLERNAIALLSDNIAYSASASWLGQHCSRSAIAKSGLWNVNHIGVPYDPEFLDVFSKLVEAG